MLKSKAGKQHINELGQSLPKTPPQQDLSVAPLTIIGVIPDFLMDLMKLHCLFDHTPSLAYLYFFLTCSLNLGLPKPLVQASQPKTVPILNTMSHQIFLKRNSALTFRNFTCSFNFCRKQVELSKKQRLGLKRQERLRS